MSSVPSIKTLVFDELMTASKRGFKIGNPLLMLFTSFVHSLSEFISLEFNILINSLVFISLVV